VKYKIQLEILGGGGKKTCDGLPCFLAPKQEGREINWLIEKGDLDEGKGYLPRRRWLKICCKFCWWWTRRNLSWHWHPQQSSRVERGGGGLIRIISGVWTRGNWGGKKENKKWRRPIEWLDDGPFLEEERQTKRIRIVKAWRTSEAGCR
jgi:hypothetical protein